MTPEAYLEAIEHPVRRADAARLDALFRELTDFAPRLWSGKMLGYGRYHYRYASGHEGSWFATGFAPAKAHMTVYILPGYADFGEILSRLGKHRKGKSCLYFNKLADIDEAVLAELVRAGLEDLATRWVIEAT